MAFGYAGLFGPAARPLVCHKHDGVFPEALTQVLSPPIRDRRHAWWNDSANPATAVLIQRSVFQNQAVAIPWLGKRYNVKSYTVKRLVASDWFVVLCNTVIL